MPDEKRVVTIHAAKTHLSQLIAQVEAGAEIVIARDTTPVAKLVPLERPASKRRIGAMAGKVAVTRAFFEPSPGDELSRWE